MEPSINNKVKLIEAEILIIKRMKNKYENRPGKKKRDVIKDYLIFSGGVPFIIKVFGGVKNFLIALGPESYNVGFTRQYIDKLELYFEELQNIGKEVILNG